MVVVMEIKLETLSLNSFDINNKDHIVFLKNMIHDKSITTRFNGFLPRLNSKSKSIFDKAFLLVNDTNIIGFVDIGAFNKEERAVYLRGAIDKSNRGNNNGHKMLYEVSNFIFSNYPNVEKIKLNIAKDNIASIKTAESCGFYNMLNGFYEKRNPYITKNSNIRTL